MKGQKPSRIRLVDGIYVNFIENDRYKTNFITYDFVTALNAKTASYNTLLSRVLTRGCEAYPTQMALNRALDFCYDAELSSDSLKVGEWHVISLQASLLDNAFSFDGEDITSRGMDLLEGILFRPYLPDGAFDGAYLKGEKKLALDEIASLVNNKARYAKGRMIEHMCKTEPYATCAIGKSSEIRKITPESLAAYYHQLLKTAHVEIFFVGRFDREEMLSRVKAGFAGIRREYHALSEPSIRTKARGVKEVTETMDVTQANLVMGFRTGCSIYDPAWRAMTLYNSVLGGSLTSKLFCNLREKMSLCYSVHSAPDALKGILTVYAGIAPENRDVAVKAALEQMDQIRRGNVTADELENARGALIHALRGLQDNPAALADWYLPRLLAGQESTPDEIIEELTALTAEDVIKVSERLTLDTVYTLTGKEGK